MINLGKTSTGYNGQSSHVIDVPVVPQGKWGETVNWRLLEGKIPNDELVTAVFGLLIVESGVVLVTTTRGYLELLGGHREAGETIEQTLDRESYEEGGVKVIERIPIETEPNPENVKYLETKKFKMGHLLTHL